MPSQPARLHVLIVGGGIGGLCLAQGLRKAGVSVTVYERDRSRTDRLEGFRIHINPAGSRALHACLPPALWDTFVATGARPGGTGFVTEQLKELVAVDEELMYPAADNPVESQHAVDRVTLRELLLAGLDDVVNFDKKFERYERTRDGKVTAFFADGASATGDVLVGADGATSRVCQQYLPQATRVDTDAIAVGHKLTLTEQSRQWLPPRLAARMNVVMTRDPFFLFTAAFDRRNAPGEALHRLDGQAVLDGPSSGLLADRSQDYDSYILCAFVAQRDAFPPGVAELDGPALQRLVQRTIGHWHADLRRVVADSDPQSVALVPFKYSLPPAPWKTTNVTVLGDAIHSMPPAPGLGGNTALRDAHLLCRALTAVSRGACPLVPAIREYETEMIEYGSAAVRAALATTCQGISSNRLLAVAAKTWFRICAAAPPLKRITFGNMWAKYARPRPWEHTQPTFQTRPNSNRSATA